MACDGKISLLPRRRAAGGATNAPYQEVRGIGLDAETRCAHYRTARDIVAIRMKCCGTYYACKDCHDTLAGHVLKAWPRAEWDHQAVLCGACGSAMTIGEYLACESSCPACAAPFNPECRRHFGDYFEAPG